MELKRYKIAFKTHEGAEINSFYEHAFTEKEAVILAQASQIINALEYRYYDVQEAR